MTEGAFARAALRTRGSVSTVAMPARECTRTVSAARKLFFTGLYVECVPNITTSTLPNGLPLHRVALPGTRATTILVAFDAGARTERPEENGMAHFLEHLVFKGGELYDDYRKVNETAERIGGGEGGRPEPPPEPRPRRLPHHGPCRVGDGSDRPPDRLRRPAEDRRGRARPRARRRHPGDPALQGPAVRRRRGGHRPRCVRRPPARAHRARPRGPPAHVHARRDRCVPRAPLVRPARRRVRRRQPRARAAERRGRRPVRPLPRAAAARAL